VTVRDVPTPLAWLDIVWSLVILDHATPQQVASVLDPDFYIKLAANTGIVTGFDLSLLP